MACTSGILLAYLLNYILVGPEMLIFLFCYLIFIIAIFVYITRTGVIIALIVLALIGYTAFIYYPESPYNLFFWIVIAYDMSVTFYDMVKGKVFKIEGVNKTIPVVIISVTFYDMVKGKVFKIEDETFKAHWWRVAMRPFAILFIIFYVFYPQITTLQFIGIVALSFIVFDIYRFMSKQANELIATKVKALLRKTEFKKFSSMTIFLVAMFITILLFQKNVAIIASSFLIFGDSFGKLFGLAFGRHKLLDKTLEGTLAYIGSVLIMGYILYTSLNIPLIVLILGGISAPLVEMFSMNLNDNFTVPLITGSIMTVALLFGL